MSFVFFMNFYNVKNHAFKSVSSKGGGGCKSSYSSSKSYSNFNKKNPDINLRKYYKTSYNYNYRPYYYPRSYYFMPTPIYSSYYYPYRPINYYKGNVYENSFIYRIYGGWLIFFCFIFIIFALILTMSIFIDKKRYFWGSGKNRKSYKYVNEPLNFNNENVINNINNLLIPEILQVKTPDYDKIPYYIFNTRDDDNKIENPNIFIKILDKINETHNIKNIEIILSPTNIFFLNLPNVMDLLKEKSHILNIHCAFIKEFYESDFNLIELRDILKNLCNVFNNSPIKIIGYNFDEDEKNSFSPHLNLIFNENLNLLKDFENLQFVKIN